MVIEDRRREPNRQPSSLRDSELALRPPAGCQVSNVGQDVPVTRQGGLAQGPPGLALPPIEAGGRSRRGARVFEFSPGGSGGTAPSDRRI